MKKTELQTSIRCFFGGKHYTHHMQTMNAKDLGKWVEAYRFTQPNVEAIIIKVYCKEREGVSE